MGDDNVQLSIISSECISFEKGDKIIIGGNEYTIRTTVNRDLISEDHYQSDAIFYGVMYELMKTQYRDCDANGKSTRSTFDLTYSIKDFVKVIIYNLNRDYPGLWAFDEDNCPDTDPITIQFSKQNCLQVLQSLCSESNFKLEFKISQANGVRTIHIGKFGAKIVPPGGREFFEWGKGNGLYTLKEKKIDDKSIKTRLWIEGGTTNIRADYRNYSERLQLPFPRRLNKHKHTLADGTVIEAESEMIGILNDNDRFIEDADLREALGSDEDTAQYDNIYPRRTGEVTALVEGDINSFVDDTMDFDLTEKDANGTKYLINEVSAKINFISGLLAGQQFELAAYDHSSNTFTLKPYTDNRGLTIPTAETEAYRIRTGDKYTITEINLPKSYEDDAEEELWYAGKEDFDGMKQARAQYDLTLDRKYLIDNTPSDAETSIFNVGDYVPIKDVRFGIEKSIRIQKVVRNLLVDQDYTLTLSDTTKISVAAQTVIDVINHEQIIVNNRLRDLNKARRGWRTTEDLRNMVYDTDGFFDTDNIRPNSIDTNMLTVGSKSQQFVLTDVILQANVGGLPNRFDASAGVLSHLTINDDAIMHWNMGASEFTLGSPGGYYLFAKCSKSGNTGVWFLTQQQLRFEPEDDPNNYYFQVGILSPLREGDNFRDFVTTYGFTRINGNTITTGKIVTSDGECYLDLDGNRFRIGDAASSIDWNVTARNRITLRNVSVLSGSGDTSELGVFRGTYNPNYIYYKGDEVTYTHNGETCTYRYINPEPSMGNAPTNSVYWSIVAKGAAGEQGNSIYYTYHDGKEKPQKPTGNGTTGGWHTTSTESVIWMSIKSAKNAESGTWGEPIRVRGADGASITIKGSTDSVSKLPMTGNTQGDAYIIGDNLYIWYGTNWQNVGQIKGEDGKSSYLHLKYSDDGGVTFTAGNGETPGRWMGTLVDQIPTDSDNPSDYKWNDTKGERGTPGEPGEDGQTTYLHIKYSNDGGLSFTANNGEDPGSYIGQYTDFQEYDSSNPADYTWSLIRGGAGVGGADAAAGEYYEYRYAKNGSTLEPPALDKTATNPTGWSKTMPTVGTMEYVWCTMSKKSTLVDQTKFYIPVTAGSVADNSGNGYNATLYNGASIIQDGSRFAVSLNNGADARIPYDLPFGENFTLCFWIKINKTQIKWMINGYNGRDYTEQNINLQANTWIHLAFRFSGNSVTVYKNGVIQSTGTTNEMLVGWCIYDDDMFGASTLYFDDVRLLMGALPVSDIIAVMNGNVDKLIQNWSDPIRVSPYDGKDGKPGDKGDKGDKGDPGTKGDSPVLVYRGAYSSSKTYYGNSRRLDAVKYNNIYYIARIDAGEFSNIAPTNTGKWNTFGAQFETIATNLLLAEGANIGDWFMSGGKIVSTLSGSNKITLDASVAQILIESDNDGGGYSMNNFGTIIKLNASQGMLEVRAKNSPSYSTGTAYLSPNGIFANLAGTNAMPDSSGYTHRGAIVGLGFANVAKRDWQLNALETIVAGVYGKASNSGTAPAFGGFFYDLYAGGLTLGKRAISGTEQTVYLNAADTMIIGYTSDTSIVYLPANPKEGQVVWVKQWWTGTMRVRPRTGHHIYDDNTENEYYDFDCGRAGMFVFTIGYITSGNTTTKKEAWLVSAWKW